jgi:hypothetical protein
MVNLFITICLLSVVNFHVRMHIIRGFIMHLMNHASR